ncbi:MAG TPA: DUF1501 domain-containing protein [Verrucomicrobiae bacterium]|nr:DUF1501 domain-containing protein [Verrucomicrobiae bacterium]
MSDNFMGRSILSSAEVSSSAAAALSRRHFLSSTAGGMAGIALAWLLDQDQARAAVSGSASSDSRLLQPVASARLPHFVPRAQRVVQIFCCGGVSHLDTFDYKPDLAKCHGQALEGKGENLGFFGQPGKVMKSPYTFRQHGQCGAWVSSLLPHLASCVDDICFIHSMFARSNNHTPATFQMNSGFTMNGFPSMGAWLSYGLGTINENLPAFVVLPDPRGLIAGGSINWTSGFLPANHQGVPFRTQGRDPILDLHTPERIGSQTRAADMDLLAAMNRSFAEQHPGDDAFAARLRSYELAARMQVSIPEATNLDDESPATRQLYGLENDANKGFARNCLMARRLLERGVRFVQIFNGGAFGSPRINWDGHENLKENHDNQAATMDQPVAALLMDLKQRGMLEDTLFVWATEFGRGPATQGINSPGRDHHPTAFTCFLAGAGVKRGYAHGRTDEVGYFVSDGKVTIPDFHATILHLLGLDHERLTFYHNGINRRLTDVHGQVVQEILNSPSPA